MARVTKEAVEADTLTVVADAGYSNGADAAACERDGITPCVPANRAVNNQGDFFDRTAFSYEPQTDTFRCPAGRVGGAVTDTVHNHDNYAWRETHEGRDVWVVRKGATPAFPGQRGFVGGSMGDDAMIIEGVESPQARASLYSTVHGAGRLFGRKEAKRRWLQDRGVTLVGADLDESPMAYRRLPEVIAQHAGTVKVLTLRPFAVVMAGTRELDPWKD